MKLASARMIQTSAARRVLRLCRAAARNLLRARVRLAFPVMALATGVIALGVSTGIRNRLTEDFEEEARRFGRDTVSISRDSTSVSQRGVDRGTRPLAFDQLFLDRARPLLYPGCELLGISSRHLPIVSSFTRADLDVIALQAEWFRLNGTRPTTGRLLTAADESRRSKVAVLTTTAQRQLFGSAFETQRRLRVGGIPLEVVGVVPDLPELATSNDAGLVLVPLELGATTLWLDRELTVAQLICPEPARSASASRILGFWERQRPRDPLKVGSPLEVLRLSQERESTVAQVFGLGGWLLLALGAFGGLALQLLIVRRQRSEVGLRRALGATRGAIMSQFLLEALGLISFSISLGFVVGGLLHQAPFWSKSLDWSWTGAAVGAMAGGCAIFCGTLVPALLAARVDPARALRG